MWYTASHCCWTGLTMRFFAAYTSHSADTRAIPVFIALCAEKKNSNTKMIILPPVQAHPLLAVRFFFITSFWGAYDSNNNYSTKETRNILTSWNNPRENHPHRQCNKASSSPRSRHVTTNSFVHFVVRSLQSTMTQVAATAAATATTGCFPLDKMAGGGDGTAVVPRDQQ